MVKRSARATYLAERLSGWARGPLVVAWEPAGVGRGGWWVRWTDGPSVAVVQAQALALGRWVRPLDVAALRYARRYSPRAWALALLAVAEAAAPGDDLLGLAEAWLDEAEGPDAAVTRGAAGAAAALVRRGDGREYAMARLLAADRVGSIGVTKAGNETGRCQGCGGPVVRARTGRPARYCCDTCRVRAWRAQASSAAVTETGNETGRCQGCGAPVIRARTGRPARYCCDTCRVRAWRATRR